MRYLNLTLREIHEALISKKVTPLDLVNEAFENIKADTTNSIETLNEEGAIEKAKNLGEPTDSLFWGVPYVAKDNFSTKGIETTGSSNMLNGYIPVYDATVIKKLDEAGAILVAKATMDELAMGGSGTTGHKGTTYNPYDPSHTHLIGGSSCGSAALCAGGVVPFTLGSDTGDSVRKPASYGGLTGFKPTWGLISRFGMFPFATSMDHVGFFTRNAYDSAALLTLLSGEDKNDMSCNGHTEDYTSYIGKDIKGKKIAVINGIVNSLTNKTVIDKFNYLLGKLKDEGAIVDYVDVDLSLLKAILPTYIVISCCEATSNNANLDGVNFGVREPGKTYQEVMINTRTKNFSELIKRRFVIGQYALLRENQEELFLRAQKARRMIVNAFDKIYENYDYVVLPASPNSAPLIGKGLDRLSDESLIADNYMAFGNFGGFPSITVPLGFDNDLPFGLNITGKAFDDGKVLQLADRVNKILGYENLSVLNKEDLVK